MSRQSVAGTPGQAFKNILKSVSDDMQLCIQNCLMCHQTCEQMIAHCLNKGGRHATPDHIRLLQDCADICEMSADFMLRGSPFHSRTCAVCAEICRACAADCDSMADDEMMKACADMCRRCADSCQTMGSYEH
jgi:hypothetical protein